MHIKNTGEEYGLLARSFHWIIAVLIIALLPVGLFMTNMENAPIKFQVYAMHKSFGLLVLFLGIARIVWRFVSPPPKHLHTHQRWEVALAGAAHFWLYLCVIGMPLTGWLMSSAAEFPIPFFGVQLPGLMGKNEQWAEYFEEAHTILAYTLLFILGLHVAGALKHHVIDRDETLQRMAYKSGGIVLPAIVVFVVGLSFTICAFFLYKDLIKERPAVQADAVSQPIPAVPEAGNTDTSSLPKDGWAIVKEQSTLKFQASLYNAPFTGDLKDFSGTIIFNPDDLANAKADIRIGMNDVATGDADRDTNIKGAAWFDAGQFPDSRFQTTKFEKVDGDNYVAEGNLTIRDVTLPIKLPFSLKIENGTATMVGKATLNRLDYKMGTGEWEDEKTVGHTVEVMMNIVAVQ